MSESQQAAAPESGDQEIEALLDFEPVPRKVKVEGGWTPELQRQFIARLAVHGSATKASDELGKNQTGIMKLYRSPLGASFRAAWDGAVELAERRKAERAAAEFVSPGTMPPTLDHRRKHPAPQSGPLPGQVVNEYGEYEDEESYRRRGEEAKDSISDKLLRSRRLFLMSISRQPIKRAAFEILTELPIDWEKAETMEPQADEPWRKPNMRNADVLLTAENGWMGDFVHGPDKKAELARQLNEWRAEQGLEPLGYE